MKKSVVIRSILTLGMGIFGFAGGFTGNVTGGFAVPAAKAARVAHPAGQTELIAAQEANRGVNFIEVSGVKVVRLLKDDLTGSKHQKWVVQLANGREVAAVYNIDVTPRIPLKVGDVIAMGGQYIYDRGGGLLHWLHEDGRRRRPNGYVEVNGVRYGSNGGDGIYKN